jgi:hypothetical protein
MPVANANTAVPAQAHADTLARQVRLARPANWDSISTKAKNKNKNNWMAKRAKHLVYFNK